MHSFAHLGMLCNMLLKKYSPHPMVDTLNYKYMQTKTTLHVKRSCPNKEGLQPYLSHALNTGCERLVFADTVIDITQAGIIKGGHVSTPYIADRCRAVKPITHKAYDVYRTFPGLRKACKEFIPFTVLDYAKYAAKGSDYEYLLFIKWNEPIPNAEQPYGLCVWNMRRRKFIDEPNDLKAWNISLLQLYSEYGMNTLHLRNNGTHQKATGLR